MSLTSVPLALPASRRQQNSPSVSTEKWTCESFESAAVNTAQLSEGIVLAKEQETCLAIRPASAWNRFMDEMRRLGTIWNQDYRDFQRRYTAGAFDTQLDAAGRVMLPQALIDKAGLGREVMLVGNLDTIEVWDRARWREEEARLDEAVPELARRLSGAAGDTTS